MEPPEGGQHGVAPEGDHHDEAAAQHDHAEGGESEGHEGPHHGQRGAAEGAHHDHPEGDEGTHHGQPQAPGSPHQGQHGAPEGDHHGQPGQGATTPPAASPGSGGAANKEPYRLKRGRGPTDDSFVVPIVPEASALAYATDQAFVAVPEKCVASCALPRNFAGSDDKKSVLHWIGRVSTLAGDSPKGVPSALRHYADKDSSGCVRSCKLPWAILLTGSSGLVGSNWRFAAMLVDLGYGVVVPDSFAAPAAMKLRRREGQASPTIAAWSADAKRAAARYWGVDPLYTSKCSWTPEGGQYPFCYSSSVPYILSDTGGWQEFYERVYLLRKRELDHFLDHPPQFIDSQAPFLLFGHSEGAMVAGRYTHPSLEKRLTARVISSWSCEFNYFVSSASSAQLCGGACNVSVPMLNMIGNKDEYFSSHQSIAKAVVTAPGGYGDKHLVGHCFAAFRAHKIKGLVALLDGATHDGTLTHDLVMRRVLRGFLTPNSAPTPLCSVKEQGLLFCRPSNVADAPAQSHAKARGSSWGWAILLVSLVGAAAVFHFTRRASTTRGPAERRHTASGMELAALKPDNKLEL